jgi:hypothetical protein
MSGPATISITAAAKSSEFRGTAWPPRTPKSFCAPWHVYRAATKTRIAA